MPGRRPPVALERLDRRGLAGAVRARAGPRPARRRRERQAVDRRVLAVADGELVDLDRRARRRRSPAHVAAGPLPPRTAVPTGSGRRAAARPRAPTARPPIRCADRSAGGTGRRGYRCRPCSTSAASAPSSTRSGPGWPGGATTSRQLDRVRDARRAPARAWPPSATTSGPGSTHDLEGGRPAPPRRRRRRGRGAAGREPRRSASSEQRARRRGRARSRPSCATCCCASPTSRPPTRPTAPARHDNVVVARRAATTPTATASTSGCPHWDIGAELGILDLERGAKLSGSMFVMYRGAGRDAGCGPCASSRSTATPTPTRRSARRRLVLTATLIATGQLPKFADDAYHLERDDLWAIPTAEVPLTSLARDEILDEAELPMRLMAYTPCFRREAGSAGTRHPRPAAGARVRQGRAPRLRHARAGARHARRDPRAGPSGLIARPRPRLPHPRHLHRRPRPVATTARSTSRSTRPASTSGSRCRRCRGSATTRPAGPTSATGPARGGKGTEMVPHAQRLGPGRAPGVGRAGRDPPPARRLGAPARGAAALHARRHRPSGRGRPERVTAPGMAPPPRRRPPPGPVGRGRRRGGVRATCVVLSVALVGIGDRNRFNRWSRGRATASAPGSCCALRRAGRAVPHVRRAASPARRGGPSIGPPRHPAAGRRAVLDLGAGHPGRRDDRRPWVSETFR